MKYRISLQSLDFRMAKHLRPLPPCLYRQQPIS